MINISEYYTLEKSLNESIYIDDDYDKSLDILLEMLSLRLDSDDFYMSLTENITIINTFSEYMPLIEAVDVVNDLNKSTNELKKAPNENVFNKVFKSLKNLVNWYYKIEPDKKFKTFHAVLRIVMRILVWVLQLYLNFSIGKKVAGTNAFKNITAKAVASAPSIIKPEITERLIKLILNGVIGSIIQALFNPIEALSDKVEYEINKKDLDKNIKELDNSIEIINKKLSNDKLPPEVKEKLIKARENLSSTLAKLIKLKDKHSKGI